MDCCVCGINIPRGQRYKTERYQSKYFCSQQCYEQYIAEKNVDPFIELKDYIRDIYGGSENVDWLKVARQIPAIRKEHGLTYQEIHAIIRYAMELEGHQLNHDYMLRQFFPQYIQPYKQFKQRLDINKETVKNIGDEITEYEIVHVKSWKRRKYIKEVDWDE